MVVQSHAQQNRVWLTWRIPPVRWSRLLAEHQRSAGNAPQGFCRDL